MSFAASSALAAAADEVSAAGGVPTVAISARASAITWDVSSIALLLFGSAVAVSAAAYGARVQHSEAIAAASAAAHQGQEVEEPLAITAPMALTFLCIASTFLIGLYFLLRMGFKVILLLLVLVFVLASSNSVAVLLQPCVHRMLPSRARAHTVVLPAPVGRMPLDFLITSVLGLAVGVLWFACRRSGWAWMLQDLLAASVCFVFMRAIRFPSLRVAAILEGLMFGYDVFMVFLSPLIFHDSVMLSVATAGEPSASVGASGVCETFEGERMPMLIHEPRLTGGSDHGNAKHGHGHVVIPGLLLSLARRADIVAASAPAKQRTGGGGACAGYFVPCAVAYVVGLGLAFLANTVHFTIFDVAGQPALFYLVPCMLGATVWRACRRNEFAAMWDGSRLEIPELADMSRPPGAAASSIPERRPCCGTEFAVSEYGRLP
jgi:hypothetical protein